jgi:pyrophosphatase PpaX
MYEFKAILFDVDGTLLDTTEFIFQAFEHVLNKFGYPSKSRTEFARLIGRPLDYNYSVLAPGSDIESLSKAHRDFQLEHLDLAKAYPSTEATLNTIREAGLKIAAVTTRSRLSTLETLKLCDIDKYMDYVVAFEDVVNVKPHPEPIYKALKYLEIDPENSVMAGDSDADILAGKNAGTLTVGVTYGFHGMRIAESDPDFLIDNISEIVPLVLPFGDLEDVEMLLK